MVDADFSKSSTSVFSMADKTDAASIPAGPAPMIAMVLIYVEC